MRSPGTPGPTSPVTARAVERSVPCSSPPVRRRLPQRLALPRRDPSPSRPEHGRRRGPARDRGRRSRVRATRCPEAPTEGAAADEADVSGVARGPPGRTGDVEGSDSSPASISYSSSSHGTVGPRRVDAGVTRQRCSSFPSTTSGRVPPERDLDPAMGEVHATSKPVEYTPGSPSGVTVGGSADSIDDRKSSNDPSVASDPSSVIHTLFGPPSATSSNGSVMPLVSMVGRVVG